MKKLFIIGALAMGALLTSCNTENSQCWKISVTYEGGKSSTYYFWGTGAESDAQLKQYEKIPGITRVGKEQALFVSQSDCQKLND